MRAVHNIAESSGGVSISAKVFLCVIWAIDFTWPRSTVRSPEGYNRSGWPVRPRPAAVKLAADHRSATPVVGGRDGPHSNWITRTVRDHPAPFYWHPSMLSRTVQAAVTLLPVGRHPGPSWPTLGHTHTAAVSQQYTTYRVGTDTFLEPYTDVDWVLSRRFNVPSTHYI